MPTAFVTGGSGFIGGHLLRRLVGDGWTVKALARSETSAGKVAAAGAEPISGSLADAEALARGVAGAEVVFHAAAKVAEAHRCYATLESARADITAWVPGHDQAA